MKKENIFSFIFVLSLALMPLIALITPRFLAFWPGIIGLVSLSFYHFSFGRWPEVPKKPLLVVFIIVALAGLSSLWALDAAFAIERTGKIALVLFPAMAFLSVCRSIPVSVVRPYLKMLPVVFGLAAFAAGIELCNDLPLSRLIYGLAPEDNAISAKFNRGVIAVSAVFFVVTGIARLTFNLKIISVLFVVMGFLLLSTSSQSAQLGFIFALICFFLFPYSRRKVWYALGVILSVAVLAAPFLAIWLFDSFAESISTMPFLGQGGGYGGQRLEIWDGVSRYALQSPLYGFGIEATRAVDAFDMAQIYRKSVTALHPHNFAIQLWIEFGIIGVGLCIAFLMSLFHYFSGFNIQQARIMLPSFVVLFTAASFGYGVWQSWFLGLIAFTMGFAILAVRLHEDKV